MVWQFWQKARRHSWTITPSSFYFSTSARFYFTHFTHFLSFLYSFLSREHYVYTAGQPKGLNNEGHADAITYYVLGVYALARRDCDDHEEENCFLSRFLPYVVPNTLHYFSCREGLLFGEKNSCITTVQFCSRNNPI